jgi:hypothetical protein
LQVSPRNNARLHSPIAVSNSLKTFDRGQSFTRFESRLLVPFLLPSMFLRVCYFVFSHALNPKP